MIECLATWMGIYPEMMKDFKRTSAASMTFGCEDNVFVLGIDP